jgi:hypothetical protein
VPALKSILGASVGAALLGAIGAQAVPTRIKHPGDSDWRETIPLHRTPDYASRSFASRPANLDPSVALHSRYDRAGYDPEYTEQQAQAAYVSQPPWSDPYEYEEETVPAGTAPVKVAPGPDPVQLRPARMPAPAAIAIDVPAASAARRVGKAVAALASDKPDGVEATSSGTTENAMSVPLNLEKPAAITVHDGV